MDSKKKQIKRAKDTDDYTPERIAELKRCIKDPVYFLKNYVTIQHPTRGPVPFKLYNYQVRLVTAIHENKNTIVLTARQQGKTTCAAMYILHMAIFSGSKKCIIASKNLKHATEIMKRIKFAYEELPSWMKPACKFYNRTSIEFMNGSEIKCEATSENTGRGDSPSILLVDECAFLPRRIQEEMWASLQPALSTGGKFIITSTPNGDDDLFASLWRGALSGANNFYPVHVLWNEHPERGDEYLREMFSNLGNLKCRQEVLCEFLSSESLLVDSVKLGSLKPEPFLWEHNACKFWVPKEEIGGRNKTYMVSLDPSAGGGADFSAIEVFEFPSMRQVAELRMNDLVPGIIYGRLKWMLTFLTTPKNGHSSSVYWTFERNSVGEAISALYWADENPIDAAELISDSPTKYGVYTTETAKIQFCLMLKRMIEKINGIVPKSSNIINELKHFASKGRSYAAKPGMTDDCVMAMVGIMRIITYISGSDEEAFRMVNEFIDPNEAMNKTESEQLVEALPIVF